MVSLDICAHIQYTIVVARRYRKGAYHMEENIMSVFKSYLRRLLQDLKDLKEVLKNKEYDKAEKMVDKLIDDTQSGIEDN